jgi:DNA-binding GntR family transcriptional regulator
LKATSLTEAAVQELRHRIISGTLKPGAKLTERDVAQLLGIGRMPAREALMALTHQGLIINNSESRKVVELGSAQLRSLYRVRITLERMAVASAAQNITPERALRLEDKLKDLKFACDKKDASLTTRADLALHEEIWRQSDDYYVTSCLENMRGVIFLTVMQGSLFGRRVWTRLYAQHRELVDTIISGDAAAAAEQISRHIVDANDESISFKIDELETNRKEEHAAGT